MAMSAGLDFAASTSLRIDRRTLASFTRSNSFLSMRFKVLDPWLFLSSVSAEDKSRTKVRKDENNQNG